MVAWHILARALSFFGEETHKKKRSRVRSGACARQRESEKLEVLFYFACAEFTNTRTAWAHSPPGGPLKGGHGTGGGKVMKNGRGGSGRGHGAKQPWVKTDWGGKVKKKGVVVVGGERGSPVRPRTPPPKNQGKRTHTHTHTRTHSRKEGQS